MRPFLMLALLLTNCAPVQTPGRPLSVRPVRTGEQFVDANGIYTRLNRLRTRNSVDSLLRLHDSGGDRLR